MLLKAIDIALLWERYAFIKMKGELICEGNRWYWWWSFYLPSGSFYQFPFHICEPFSSTGLDNLNIIYQEVDWYGTIWAGCSNIYNWILLFLFSIIIFDSFLEFTVWLGCSGFAEPSISFWTVTSWLCTLWSSLVVHQWIVMTFTSHVLLHFFSPGKYWNWLFFPGFLFEQECGNIWHYITRIPFSWCCRFSFTYHILIHCPDNFCISGL